MYLYLAFDVQDKITDSKNMNTLAHKRVKAVSQAWSGPEGSRNLRFPDFMTTAQGGGKFVSLTHRPLLPSGHLVLISVRC
jgi:hypothetical protein